METKSSIVDLVKSIRATQANSDLLVAADILEENCSKLDEMLTKLADKRLYELLNRKLKFVLEMDILPEGVDPNFTRCAIFDGIIRSLIESEIWVKITGEPYRFDDFRSANTPAVERA